MGSGRLYSWGYISWVPRSPAPQASPGRGAAGLLQSQKQGQCPLLLLCSMLQPDVAQCSGQIVCSFMCGVQHGRAPHGPGGGGAGREGASLSCHVGSFRAQVLQVRTGHARLGHRFTIRWKRLPGSLRPSWAVRPRCCSVIRAPVPGGQAGGVSAPCTACECMSVTVSPSLLPGEQ